VSTYYNIAKGTGLVYEQGGVQYSKIKNVSATELCLKGKQHGNFALFFVEKPPLGVEKSPKLSSRQNKS
jgi:hypothetical protein